MDKPRILGIVGSLRRGSYNRLALKAAQGLVPDGAVLELIELHGLPVFDQPEVMIANAAQRFDAEGRLGDEPTRTLIRTLLKALVKLEGNVPADSRVRLEHFYAMENSS